MAVDAAYQMEHDGIAQARGFLFDEVGHLGTALTSAMAFTHV